MRKKVRWTWCYELKVAIGWWWDVKRDLHSDGRGKKLELELNTDELVDVALGINYAQGFDLNVDLHSVDVDDVAPPTIELSDAKCNASLLSDCLLDKSSYFGGNKIISFKS